MWETQGIQLRITYIFKETNMAPHWLSKFGHSITTSCSNICFSPPLRAILADDVVGHTLARKGV